MPKRYAKIVFACLILFCLTQNSLCQGIIGQSKKYPIPSKVGRKKALDLIKELYAPEYKSARKSSAARLRLAGVLFQEGKDTNDYPAGRFVLFEEASQLAVTSGDASLALQIIGVMANSFQLPPSEILGQKVTVLKIGAEKAEPSMEIANAALLLVDEALANDNFSTGKKLLQIAEKEGIDLRNVPLVTQIRKLREKVHQQELVFRNYQPFFEKLISFPNDPKANQKVGWYYALEKGDWNRGLPYLSKSQDPQLKIAAKWDLQKPTTAKDQIKLAEKWLDYAGNIAKKEFKYDIYIRSYGWLQKAQLGLTKKERENVLKTMRSIMDRLPPEYQVGEIVREVLQIGDLLGSVYSARFSPNGKLIVTGSADNTVRVLDRKSGKLIRSFAGHTGPVWSVAFAPNNRQVLSGSFDGSIRLWDIPSGNEIRRFIGHNDYVRSVAFSFDGNYILSGSDDRTVRLWNTATGKEIRKLTGHKHFVWSVAFSGDSTTAVSAGLDKTVRIWNLELGKEQSRLVGPGDTILSVALSPGGNRVLAGSTDQKVHLWDFRESNWKQFSGHKDYVTSVAFSPDGRRAISGSYDQTLRLWNLGTGECIRTLKGHTERIWATQFSPSGRWALSTDHAGNIKIWGGAK